jgi:hypothetical protein
MAVICRKLAEATSEVMGVPAETSDFHRMSQFAAQAAKIRLLEEQ